MNGHALGIRSASRAWARPRSPSPGHSPPDRSAASHGAVDRSGGDRASWPGGGIRRTSLGVDERGLRDRLGAQPGAVDAASRMHSRSGVQAPARELLARHRGGVAAWPAGRLGLPQRPPAPSPSSRPSGLRHRRAERLGGALGRPFGVAQGSLAMVRRCASGAAQLPDQGPRDLRPLVSRHIGRASRVRRLDRLCVRLAGARLSAGLDRVRGRPASARRASDPGALRHRHRAPHGFLLWPAQSAGVQRRLPSRAS